MLLAIISLYNTLKMGTIWPRIHITVTMLRALRSQRIREIVTIDLLYESPLSYPVTILGHISQRLQRCTPQQKYTSTAYYDPTGH